MAFARWSRLGELLLHRFFAFAAAFDDFDSVLADDDLWVPVPHPDRVRDPSSVRTTGRPIRYLCRLDQLIADPDDEWWVVDHRLSWGRWATDDELLGDAADGANVVGARDRVPADPRRGHGAQRAPGHRR